MQRNDGGVVGNRTRKRKRKNTVPRGVDRVEEIRSSRRAPARDIVEEHRQEAPLRARPSRGRAGSGVPEKRRTAGYYDVVAGGRRPHPQDPALAEYIRKRGAKGAIRGVAYGILGEDTARGLLRAGRSAANPLGLGDFSGEVQDRLELDDQKPIDPKDLAIELPLWLPPVRTVGGAARGAKALATGKGAVEAAEAARAGYRSPIRGALAARRLKKFEKGLGEEATARRRQIHGLIDETLPDHNERVATKELYDLAAESMGRRTGGSADDFYTKFAGATTEPPVRMPAPEGPARFGAPAQDLEGMGDLSVLYQKPPVAPALPEHIEGDQLVQNFYALAKRGAAYKDWYDRARGVIRIVAAEEGLTFHQMAKVVAITSQGANPTFNLKLAVKAVRAYKETGTIPGALPGEKGLYIFDSQKVIDVLEGRKWDGEKTNSFYQNITNSADAVTVDRHIARAAHGVENPSSKQYDEARRAIQKIAAQLGWKPKEVQAAAWIPIKAQGLADTTFARMQKKGWTEPKPAEHYFDSAGDAYERGLGRYQNDTLLQSNWAEGARPGGPLPMRAGLRNNADLERINAGAADTGTAGGRGRPDVRFAETSDLEAFNAAVRANPRRQFLTEHTPDELAGAKVFLSEDGQAGFVVTREGDLQNVFRNPGGQPGAGRAAVELALQNGAKTLDAYDGFLPGMYGDAGFAEVGRMKFIDEYAPEGWDFEQYGRPDIIFMAHGAKPQQGRYFTDWDEAKQVSLEAASAPEVLQQAEPAAKGAVSFQQDGRVILHAFKGAADVSTFVHEAGHVLRRYALNDEEEALLASWAGATARGDGTFDWHVAAEEKFARAFERYLRDGVAPAKKKGIRRIFQTLRESLLRIYEQADLPEISDDVRTVFDNLLTGKKTLTAGDKIAGSLDEAKRLRNLQEKGYSEERARRVARGEEAMSVGGLEGYHAALEELKGELPKLKFGALDGEFDQKTVEDLLTIIQLRDDLRFFERIRTQRALLNVLEGTVPTRSQIKLLEKTFGPELAQQIADSVPFWNKAKNFGLEVINIPRAVMASIDLSAPFRQGLVLGARHPKMFASEWKTMLKSFATEGAYDNAMEEIASRPTFEAMLKAGLAITDLENLAIREEQFVSNYAEFLTGGKRSPIRMSGRAYVAFLNKFRADAFDNYLRMAQDAGRDTTDEKLLKDIASWVNTATGRGSLGKHFEGSAVALNAGLFSPRLIASRVQLLNPVFYAKLDPFVRKQALQGMGQLIGAVGLTLYMAHLAGANVGLDPRSSNFGKIRLGDTRIDIAGGLQQYVVLYSRLVKGELVSSSSGQVEELSGGFAGASRASILGRFAEQKLSPVGAYIWGAMKNENFEGDEFDPAKEAGKSLIPLGFQNTYDAYSEYGAGPAAAAGSLGAVGFGVQTYPNTEPKPEPKTADDKAEEWIAEKEKAFGVALPEDVKVAVHKKALYQNLQKDLKERLDVRKLTDKQRTALKFAVLTHDNPDAPYAAELRADLKNAGDEERKYIDRWLEKELGWNELEQIGEYARKAKSGTP